jgi:tetratricopeptide (TPR) repeat protein
MKKILMYSWMICLLMPAGQLLFAQEGGTGDDDYQKKLEEWKRQKELIEKQNQDKLASMGAQQQAKAKFKQGADSYKQGNYMQAVKEFQEAIKLDPNYQKAYINLGLSYRRLGDNSQALANYDIAITMKDGDKEAISQAISYKANLYIDTKEFKKAIETMDLYLKDNPGDDGILYLKGKVLKDGLGQLKESLIILQDAVAKNPTNAKALLELTNVMNTTGDYQTAITQGLNGLKASKDAETTAALNYELGDSYRKIQNSSEAVKYYEASKTSRRWRESAEYWIKILSGK